MLDAVGSIAIGSLSAPPGVAGTNVIWPTSILSQGYVVDGEVETIWKVTFPCELSIMLLLAQLDPTSASTNALTTIVPRQTCFMNALPDHVGSSKKKRYRALPANTAL